MTWWQWTLLGVVSYSLAGLICSIAYVRYELLTRDDVGGFKVAEEAVFTAFLWPLFLLIVAVEVVIKYAKPFFRVLYIPARVRKAGKK